MAIDSDLIRGHVDTIILKTLADGDKYGYEIIKEIETKSNGTYELKQPTLYSCLKRLESQGFISAYWVNSDIGGKRHYYKLTDLGKAEYDNNMKQWLSSRLIIDNLIAETPISPTVEEETTKEEIGICPEAENFERNKNEDSDTFLQACDNPAVESIIGLEADDSQCETISQQPYTNPFADVFDENDSAGNDFLLGTDEQDLKVVEEYYNTDENQFDLFTSFTSGTETTSKDFFENNECHIESEEERGDEIFIEKTAPIESEFEPFENIDNKYEPSQDDLTLNEDADLIDNDSSGERQESVEANLEEYIVKNEATSHSSIKFNFKDYSLNNDNYFSQIKDEVGGSGFDADEQTTSKHEKISPMFDEIITNNFEEFDEEENEETPLNQFNYNEEYYESENELDDNAEETTSGFSRNINFFGLPSDLNEEAEPVEDEDEDEDTCPIRCAGYDPLTREDHANPLEDESEDNVDNYQSNRLIFGTEEENEENYSNSSLFNNYGYNFNEDCAEHYPDDEVEPVHPEDEISNYQNQNFTLRNEEALTSNYNYDYDRDEELSDSRDIAIREPVSPPAEDPQNEVSIIETNNTEISYTTIYNDPDATTNLFVDNKRSFVPQYTDNDSKQLLNTLSSYGSIRFSNTNKNSNQPKPVGCSLDELQSNFGDAGIEVRIYSRRPKEGPETKNYILSNKIKMVTSFLSYAAVSFLLVIGYLVAGPMGLTNMSFVPTALPASAYLFFTLGLMLLIPATFLTMFLMNKTKKIKPKYSAKITIIFSLLFAVQCLVIIYVINIPFGLYSFTQIDYNHMLWYLPAICTLYIPIHTIIYTFLYNSKKFHV